MIASLFLLKIEKEVNVLNEKDEVQSTLNDIENIVDKIEFVKYKK